jgi:hypothetical protein
MFARTPRRGSSPERLIRRIDRAAAQLNPILMLISVGLVILNLIALTAVVSHLQITRVQCALPDARGAARITEVETTAMPNGGLY